ncbi:hypothetical protein VINI7043_07175 [Vibrio nigripulchritudo ATCC 27043]|uniref:hypothetical protein n=1 Tax=Vibrio nigripulchritudo TaxID=28173 RepID=UPI00021C1878|nr:hypothetical protein [Vibrio nigripulchritudo]EGU57577.1 hypothetical protein VINI7043_07175 [Vibrio nigripulchritudo ATCC 27043]
MYFIRLAITLLLIAFPLSSAANKETSYSLQLELDSISQPYIQKIEQADGYRSTLLAYTTYHEFLQGEISDTYEKLQSKLTDSQRIELSSSQQLWEQYLKSNYDLIQDVWTKQDFGTASAHDRGQLKSTILLQRLKILKHYLYSL